MKRSIFFSLFLVSISSLFGQQFDTITDLRDGQKYEIVKIGNQWWMAENLNIGTYVESIFTGSDHSDVSDNDTIEKYCLENDTLNYDEYGGLYDWDEMMQYNSPSGGLIGTIQGICPSEWHVPTDNEWKELEMHLGMSQAAVDSINWRGTDEGGKLKEVGLYHWDSVNTGATNESGFSAVGSGYRGREGAFTPIDYYAYFWTETTDGSVVWARPLHRDHADIKRNRYYKRTGFSVRCVMDIDSLNVQLSGINTTSINGTDGSIDLTITGGLPPFSYNWSTGNTIEDISGLSEGVYIVTVADSRDSSRTDSIRIYDTFIDERDGQVYKALIIGDQIWMDENLNYKTSSGSYYFNNDSISHAETYGMLYTSDVAKYVCPTGLELPTYEETLELVNYLGGESVAGGKLKQTGTTLWWSPNEGATNESGFNAVPGGRWLGSSFDDVGEDAWFWTSSQVNPSQSNSLHLHYTVEYTQLPAENITMGHSVRCMRNVDTFKIILKTNHIGSVGGVDGWIQSSIIGGLPPFNFLWSTGETIQNIDSLSAGIYSLIVTDSREISITDSIELFNTITDERDQQKYKVVTIGDKLWMAENLNYYTSSGSRYYDDDSLAYSSLLGRLYTYTTSINVCPTGWGLPTYDETLQLANYLGGVSIAGGKLKENTTDLWVIPNTGATNETNFNALPGGSWYVSFFDNIAEDAWFWTSTPIDASTAYGMGMHYSTEEVTLISRSKPYGYSVRCMKEISPLDISLNSTNTTEIFGNDGSIDLSASGGIGPYKYSWSSGENTEDINNLSAGVYSVSVTDAQYKSVTDSIKIYDSFLDERDGQVYKALIIGDQIWMAENLNVGFMIDSTQDGTDNAIIEKYCYRNDYTLCDSFGGLYQWDEMMDYNPSDNGNPGTTQGICPSGWHLPTDDEWTVLIDNYPQETVGKELKLGGSSGFDVQLAGYLDNYDKFKSLGLCAELFSSTEQTETIAQGVYFEDVLDDYIHGGLSKIYGNSVRCIKNIDTLDIILTAQHTSNIAESDGTIDLAISGGLGPYEIHWSTNDTIEDLIGLETGVYSVLVNDARDSTISDSIRIYDTFIDNRDGQVYKAVTIGDQIWMAENLNAIKYSDGTAIPLVETQSGWESLKGGDKAYCYYDNSLFKADTFGLLYTWSAASNGSQPSDLIPSGIQGVCPTRWHLPSDAEFKLLESYLGMDSTELNMAGFRGDGISVKLKEIGTQHWNFPNPGATNESGFTALGSGTRSFGPANYIDRGIYTYFWSSTEKDADLYWIRALGYLGSMVLRNGYHDWNGMSVRCVFNSKQCQVEELLITKGNVSCNGKNDGSATINLAGSGPMKYMWSSGDTVKDISDLSVGWYSVKVTDSLGCSLTDSIEITQPDELLAYITDSTNVSVQGGTDGSATVTPSGGTPGYAYIWDDDLNTTDSTVTGLSANKWYHIIITDGNGCVTKDSVILSEPGVLHAEITDSSNVSCSGLSDGSATVTVLGGTPPISILWNDDTGSTTPTVTNLSPDRWYRVTVMDKDLLTAVDSVYITQPASLQILKDYSQIVCFESDTGHIYLTLTGGTAPYTFNWSNEKTTEDQDGLSAGVYSVIVTDKNGCKGHDTIAIIAGSDILNMWHLPDISDPFVNYSIGNMPSNVDSWYWSFGDGDTTSDNSSATHKYLSNGIFDLCLIGINPCDMDSSCVAFPILSSGMQEWSPISHINLYPNPTSGKVHLDIDNPENKEIEIYIMNSIGSILKIMKVYVQDVTLDMSQFPKGIYSLIIKKDKEIITRKVIHQ